MSRSSDERVVDVLEAINKCERYLNLVDDHESGDLVEMAEDAIERNLQIIGEAVSHLPADITSAHPEIPWPQIRGFRNVLVHQYFGVDMAIVRDVVETHLSALGEALSQHPAEAQ